MVTGVGEVEFDCGGGVGSDEDGATVVVVVVVEG